MKRDIISFSTYKTNVGILVLTTIFGALCLAFLGSSLRMQSVEDVPSPTTYLLIGLAFSASLKIRVNACPKND